MINPDDYWVNNPLITPVNKAMMFDNAIFMAKADETDRTIKLLKELFNIAENAETRRLLTMGIALIKGEN